MIKFDEDKVLLLHKLIIESTGGKMGVMNYDVLNSSLNNAYQTFGGVELYPTKQEKGASLGYSLISNHAFFDGNKRIGILVMLSFLDLNGICLSYSDNDIVNLGYSVAKGESKYEDVLNWIKSHEKYERYEEENEEEDSLTKF